MATAANDIIRVTCNYTYLSGGRPVSNVLHFADTGGGGITDAVLLPGMGTIIEGIFGPLAPQQSVSLFFTSYDVFNVTQGLIVGTLPWPTLVQGAIAGDISAVTVAGLLRMITAKSRVQGRINVVGTPEASLTASSYIAAFLAAALVVGGNALAAFPLGPSAVTYAVYNQVLKTFTLPVSTAIGASSRSIGRRRLP